MYCSKASANLCTGNYINKEGRAIGRPFFDGKDKRRVVAKLEYPFTLGCTVKEACIIASISRYSFNGYCRKYPEFRNNISDLQRWPVIVAKKTLLETLSTNGRLALSFLKLKRPDEYRRYI